MARFPRSSVIFHVVRSVGRLVPILGAIALATSIVAAAGKLPAVDGDALLQHIKVLASDEFEGRAPGSRGEDRTVAYLQEQFRKIGLAPGNTDGTFIQQVPMVGITPSQDSHLTLRKGNETRVLTYRDDVVAWTKHVVDRVSVDDSELVFVGYGVQAPEFNWDDYKGVDVKGKTLVMLVNDPAVPDPRDPSQLDPKIFGGKAMTYYGRWTYKYEIGARLGAAAVLIVHETGPAATRSPSCRATRRAFRSRRRRTRTWAARRSRAGSRWTPPKQLCAMAGQDFEALKKAAITREFRPVPLGVTASIAITNKIRPVDSQNVIAKLEGSDPQLKDEYVIYTAHWDHLGIGEPVNGDRSTTAPSTTPRARRRCSRSRARSRSCSRPRNARCSSSPSRRRNRGCSEPSTTPTHPIYPLTRTVANINMDGANMFGRTRDITIVGLGASDLDDYLRQAAKERGRTISPDPEPEKGYYYRSDHFNFAKSRRPGALPRSGRRLRRQAGRITARWCAIATRRRITIGPPTK